MNCFCEKFEHFGKSEEEIINKKEVQVILHFENGDDVIVIMRNKINKHLKFVTCTPDIDEAECISVLNKTIDCLEKKETKIIFN